MPLEKAHVYQNVVMKLSVLRFMVKTMSKQGKTDLNRQCESFFATILNIIDGTELKNVNEAKMNEAAIDLADAGRKLCVQVTVTNSSTKIKDTITTFLKNELYLKYKTLEFLMLGEKKNYTTKFLTDGKFDFDSKVHVRDIDDVLLKAETLSLQKLTELSAFIDTQLPSVSRALAPNSLLATAERVDGGPPATAWAYLLHSVEDEDGAEWKLDFETLVDLHARLKALSNKQREVIAYMVIHGGQSRFRHRVSMPIQTLQQKLDLDEDKMLTYFKALEKAGLMDVDGDDERRPTDFELTCNLRGTHNDAFTMLKDCKQPGNTP